MPALVEIEVTLAGVGLFALRGDSIGIDLVNSDRGQPQQPSGQPFVPNLPLRRRPLVAIDEGDDFLRIGPQVRDLVFCCADEATGHAHR